MDANSIWNIIRNPSFSEWGIITISFAVILLTLKRAITGLQNWRKRRAWNAIQKKEAAEEAKRRAERKAALVAKYGDAKVAERIMNEEIWVGQTQQMVLDTVGQPDDKDRTYPGGRTIDIWKYYWCPNDSYALIIHIEDGIVTHFKQEMDRRTWEAHLEIWYADDSPLWK